MKEMLLEQFGNKFVLELEIIVNALEEEVKMNT
jgi:hypothetical protein